MYIYINIQTSSFQLLKLYALRIIFDDTDTRYGYIKKLIYINLIFV